MKQVQMQSSSEWYKNNPTVTPELFKSGLVNEQNINAWVDLTFPNTDKSYRKEWHWRAERGTFFINMDDNSLAMWKQLVDSLSGEIKVITSNWNFDITQMPEVGNKVMFEGEMRNFAEIGTPYTVTSIKKHTRGDYDIQYVSCSQDSHPFTCLDAEVYYTNRPEMGTPDYNSLQPWRKKKDDKSFEIDLSISWCFVAKSIMAVVESHAKKSFIKSEARDEVKKQLFHMSQVADEYVAKMKEGAE